MAFDNEKTISYNRTNLSGVLCHRMGWPDKGAFFPALFKTHERKDGEKGAINSGAFSFR